MRRRFRRQAHRTCTEKGNRALAPKKFQCDFREAFLCAPCARHSNRPFPLFCIFPFFTFLCAKPFHRRLNSLRERKTRFVSVSDELVFSQLRASPRAVVEKCRSFFVIFYFFRKWQFEIWIITLIMAECSISHTSELRRDEKNERQRVKRSRRC